MVIILAFFLYKFLMVFNRNILLKNFLRLNLKFLNNKNLYKKDLSLKIIVF